MLKAEIILASLVLLCGQAVLWRRRDNVPAYLQAGLFFASVLVPVLGTTIIDGSDPAVVALYARILMLGAATYMAGLLYGGLIGSRQRLPHVTFGRPFGDAVPALIVRRSRVIAIGAIAALALSFLLLGYVPFLAADRVGAKYGTGVYRAGLERGAFVFHLALRLGSLILPVVLVMVMRRRRGLDVLIAGALGVGLLLTLSRGSALLGPLVFLIAVLVGWRWRAWQILALVCAFYVSATLVNEIVRVANPVASASFSVRVAASAPDLSDHLGFLNGYRVSGSRQVGLRTILAGLSLNKGEYNPSSYALRIRTGLVDTSEFASGGLRLPAAVWGYASLGYLGVGLWSFASGVFTGWGTVLVRRLVTPSYGRPGQALNLVLGWLFLTGTFGVVSEFYFPERVEIVSVALVLALCWRRTAPVDTGPEGEPSTDAEAPASVPA